MLTDAKQPKFSSWGNLPIWIGFPRTGIYPDISFIFKNFGGLLWPNMIGQEFVFFNCSWEILSCQFINKPKLPSSLFTVLHSTALNFTYILHCSSTFTLQYLSEVQCSAVQCSSELTTQIFLQVDSTVKEIRPVCFFGPKLAFYVFTWLFFCGQIYIIGQHFKVLQMTSNSTCIWSIEF